MVVVNLRPRFRGPTQSGGFLEGFTPQIQQELAFRRQAAAAAQEQALRREELEAERDLRRELANLRGEQSLQEIEARGAQATDLEGQRQEGRLELVETQQALTLPERERELAIREEGNRLRAEEIQLRGELGREANRIDEIGALRPRGGGSGFPLASSFTPLLEAVTQGETPTEDQLIGAMELARGNPEGARRLLGSPGGVDAGGTVRTPPGGDPVDLGGTPLADVSQDEINQLNSRPVESHVATLRLISDPALREQYLSLLNPETATAVIEAIGR